MVIEKTDNEIIFRLPADIDTAGFQRIINYLQYKELLEKARVLKNKPISWQMNPKNVGGVKIKKDL